jgi:tetratricopeptide (TPR) repeat protein
MSSLIAKTNKSRSPASQKVRTTKAKKVADKKPQRPGKITASPKAKKAAPAKTKKPGSTGKKAAAITKKAAAITKKAPLKKVAKFARVAKVAKVARVAKVAKVAKAAAAKPVKKHTVKAAKPAPARRGAKPVIPAKAAQPPPKRTASSSSLLAVKAFEQALRLFNRHDYSGAKEAFETLLTRFSEQADIIAPARTYIAISEQRMARAPVVPRNADALYDQGVVQLNKGNFAEAVALFEKGLKVEPRADHIWYSLSAAHARMNQPVLSLDALRRAISIRSVNRSQARRDPDFASLHTNEEFQQLTGFGFDFDEE